MQLNLYKQLINNLNVFVPKILMGSISIQVSRISQKGQEKEKIHTNIVSIVKEIMKTRNISTLGYAPMIHV